MRPVLRIDVLRHGETTLNHTLRGHLDDALTPTGWQQMHNTIEQFQSNAWQAIMASPLQRCATFAQWLANEKNLPLWIDADFKELNFGNWEGISTQQIYEESPDLLANFWQKPTLYHAPNGEKLFDFQTRIVQGLLSLIEKMYAQQFSNILLVTHGGVIKLMRCLAQQQPLDNILKMQAELGQVYHFQLSFDDHKQLQIAEE
ncbi:histidine phosphatase family protein [Acinetobacter sp. S40]|uniref:histidine phosphatase family protein n=1 Tax=Acinetobacter sp. S40 TaxID=2767434 RepID=UPI00190A49A3|nr:histidine phosphatase family protein [Acinetobacter sp. S40]MBJ9986675.1 histidine phosphatase family protein [Acinetobacter sp. S40]